jgi:acetyl esterase/lipase
MDGQMTETASHFPRQQNNPPLELATQEFADGLAACKERRGPRVNFQVLFSPVTGASFETASYRIFEKGPWLTKRAMEQYWAAYIPNEVDREVITVTPLNATIDQLRGVPDAPIIAAQSDILRDVCAKAL